MILAEDAKKLSYDVNSQKFNEQMNFCEEAINKSINNGDLSVCLYIRLKKEVVEELKKCGYQVDVNTHRNEVETLIRWD